MNKVLLELKDEARRMAAEQPVPGFYKDLAQEDEYSRELFFDHPLVRRMQDDVLPFLYDNFGHGVEHSKKVAVDASTIILREGRGTEERMRRIRHLAVLAQLAGLMHDIRREEPDHAQKGAETALMIMRDYPLTDEDKAMVSRAIANHEAFADHEPEKDPDASLVASALYDADKFRWGTDNFCTTLWEICDYQHWSLKEVADRFPQGMEMVRSIAETFRTDTGRKYGPEMIRTGLELGRELYSMLLELTRESGS